MLIPEELRKKWNAYRGVSKKCYLATVRQQQKKAMFGVVWSFDKPVDLPKIWR